jgi:hypothetical protein
MEKHRLKMFENCVLRRIFGPKRGEMTGGWRKLHNEEIHNLYSLSNIIRIIKATKMRCAGNVACMGSKTKKKKNVFRILMGEPEGKRLLGRSRHR